MPTPDKKVSILLNGGVDNRALDELVAPLAKQGDSPKLKRSTNTRLGVTPGGVVRAPSAALVSSYGAGARVVAAVSAEAGKRTLLLSTPELIQHRVEADAGRVASSSGTLYDDASTTEWQRSALPAQVVASEAVGANKTYSQIAISRNASTGIVWHAYVSRKSTDRILVAASTTDGASLAAPTQVATMTTARRWVGITSHGANGDRVWYVNSSGAICYRSVTVAGNFITLLGSEVAVVTPGSATAGIDVHRVSDTLAVLAHSSEAASADGRVRTVNVVTNAIVTTQTHTNAMQGGGHAAVYAGVLDGNGRIVVGFSKVTGSQAQAWLYDDTLSTMIRTHAAQTCHGRISVGLNQYSGAVEFVLAHEVLATFSVQANVFAFSESAGVIGTSASFPWYGLAGHIAPWVVDATHQYPIAQLVPRYSNTLEAPGEAHFVDDPSLDLAWLSTANGRAVIARLGVVRGTVSPAEVRFPDAHPFASHSMIGNGDDILCAYLRLQDYGGTAGDRRQGRVTTVRLNGSTRFVSAQDRDGVGFLSGALPLQWDGRRVVELGAPLHTPHMIATKAGAGPILAAGTYNYVAVFYWSDEAGLVHRSRPSAISTVTMNGATDRLELTITTPVSMANSVFELRVYATPLGGKTFHLMAAVPWSGASQIQTIEAIAVTTANAQLYSGGGNLEEIVPQPPPPAWDISVVGLRCYIVDAEIRSRIVPSKLRIAGVGFEFAPGIEILVPSGAGKAMAVREWQGMPIVLTERAVYQIAGDGPSNTLGGGGSFAPPVKIADIGCSNLASIVVCPAGILWQFGARFVLLNGNGVSYIEDFLCTHDVSAALTLTKYGEVHFYSATTAEVRIYHYETGRWTTYDSAVLANPVQVAQLMPWDQDTALVYQQATGELRRIEAGSVGSASMVFETDWLLLGGDFQDCVVLRDVVFNARRVGAHSIRVELFVDYATTAVTDRSWNDAWIGANNTNGYYTVRLEPTAKDCRAVKARVTETWGAGGGCSPRSLTIVYAIDGLLREEAFLTGSRQ